MRNFSKTLISMAAVMAVGSAMAAGAMAAMTASYDAETGVVTITDAVSNGASNTLLIVKGDANTEATEETIKQIEQVDKDEAFTSAVLGTGLTAGDTYELRVGGTSGDMQTYVFTIPGAETPVQTTEIVLGDVNAKVGLDTLDLTMILNKLKNPDKTYQKAGTTAKVGKEKTIGTKTFTFEQEIVLGDVNAKVGLDTLDRTMIMNKIKNPDKTYQLAGETLDIIVE
jgi:molybdopterin-binding protein